MRRGNKVLGIGGEEGGAGAHRNMFIYEGVKGGVFRDIDCNRMYSVPFIGGRRIHSKKPIPVDWHGI